MELVRRSVFLSVDVGEESAVPVSVGLQFQSSGDFSMAK